MHEMAITKVNQQQEDEVNNLLHLPHDRRVQLNNRIQRGSERIFCKPIATRLHTQI
jgi:hypothetical protein